MTTHARRILASLILLTFLVVGRGLAQTPSSDSSVVCRSAMTAIERYHRAVYGPQARVRIEWVKLFTYDKGDCVGGFILWVKRPEDTQEWTPLRWAADTGDGRIPVSGLVQQYAKDNPDLQWTSTPVPGASRTQGGQRAENDATGIGGPIPPSSRPSSLDYAPVCRSAMTAIERHHRAVYGPQARVRIEWVKPFTYDKGDCVGRYILWVKRPEDTQEWAPTRWPSGTGDGRVSVSAVKQQYAKDNPDLEWTPTSTPGAPTSVPSPAPRVRP